MHIKEVQEVSSKKNVKFFDGMEEGGPSKNGRGEKDIHEGLNYVPCMTRMKWRWRKYELMNHVGKMIIERKIVACDLKELVLDDDLGEINVGVIILNYPNNRSQIMSIWRWPLL